jgi:hypothetical protein
VGANYFAANGLTASSPDGGNFIAQDSAFQDKAITQTISNLIVGQAYQVGFWWGAAQQSTFTGATYDQWQVSLGAETHSTAQINLANHGFSGWTQTVLTFTATSASEVLSFLAVGGPAGVPPFALLDGVTMVAVPEPATLMLFATALLALGVFARRRSQG